MIDETSIQVQIPQAIMDKAVKDHMSETLLKTLNDDSRHTLIQGAIRALLDPARDGYHKGKSPLQFSFEQAVERFATKMIEVEFDKNLDLQKEIKDIVAQAVSRWLNEDKAKMVEKVSELISRSLYGSRY